MDKREFLKRSGALLGGSMLSRLGPSAETPAPRSNWAGNYTFKAARLDCPKTTEEVKKLVKSCTKAKALGARHSFNSIADSTGDQISLQYLQGMELDKRTRTVTVGGGVKYGQLAPYLDSQGYAVHNLASLPHVPVVGACATATHGSGSKNGNLSTAVVGMEMVTANGELVNFSPERDRDKFAGAVVGLGALGVVTKITLNVVPAFTMRQVVYENLPFRQLEQHLDEIFASGYSVSVFTDWQQHRATQVWIKSVVERGSSAATASDFFGATLQKQKLHPLAGHSAENCTEQMGIPGPWYERLPHFRMNFTPSSGDELQSEYFIPREKAYQAILAVEKLRDHVTPHLMISEFRTIEADQLWMSPCHERPAMTLHFTWKPEWQAVKQVLPMIEEQLAPFEARPHWAKLFTMAPERIQSLYPKIAEYRKQCKQYDPGAKFRNEFLNRIIYG